MIEPRSISFPYATHRFYTEEKDGVRYSGEFVDLKFEVAGSAVKVRGVPVLRKWRKVTKILALFSEEKEKWVSQWAVSGPYRALSNDISIVGGSYGNRPSFDYLINGGLKQGLVISDEFAHHVMDDAVAQVFDYHRQYEPQILRPSAVRRVA